MLIQSHRNQREETRDRSQNSEKTETILNDCAQKCASYYTVLLPLIYTGLSWLRFLHEPLHTLLNAFNIIIRCFTMRYLHLSATGRQHLSMLISVIPGVMVIENLSMGIDTHGTLSTDIFWWFTKSPNINL